MIMATPLSVRVLQQFLDAHEWTQNDLADRAQLHRATVSMHLSRSRPIRDEHLSRYLNALHRHERPILLAAWIRDQLAPDVVVDVLDLPANRVAEPVRQWGPELDEEHRRMFSWWADQLARDPELDAIFRSVTRRLGYQ
jgi:hypothetical protein